MKLSSSYVSYANTNTRLFIIKCFGPHIWMSPNLIHFKIFKLDVIDQY